MRGQTATAREIKARWAFHEVLSDRFGHPYRAILPPALYAKVKSGCKFSDTDDCDWDLLIQGLNTARDPSFTGIVDVAGSNGYVCVEWAVEDLMNVKVIPSFGVDLHYRHFLTMFPVSRSTGALDLGDPRFKVWGTPVLGPPFVQSEPLISIKVGADHMLIEGYTRSILWVRGGTKPLLVWVPA